MTPLAPHLTAFLRERLPLERQASPHTCDSYAYAFQLLLSFAAQRYRLPPSDLSIEHLDVPFVLAFLGDLESTRGNSGRTRNARLAAIKSFFHFLEYRVPSGIQQVQAVLAIPSKKTDERLIHHLTRDEMQAVLDAPDPRSKGGVRDRAMLHLAYAAGLRVSELVALRTDEVALRPQPSIHVLGKGRRERVLPLWQTTTTTLRAWLALRDKAPCPELFLNARGGPMSRDGFQHILAKHVEAAAATIPSIKQKHVSPHVLRHSCAMHILEATRDIRKVALWLGHSSVQTTEIYVRADPTAKLEAIEAVLPPTLRRGRFRAPDRLIDSLRPRRGGS
jgi:site-specific recombinase XerD